MKVLQTLDITTLEGVSQDWDIPIEWLEPNAKRTLKNNGWTFKSYIGEQTQTRLDNPFKDTETGKPVRYISAKGVKPDIMIPLNPNNGSAIDDYPLSASIVITEGAKKAIKGCSVGIPTISVSGIWNGLRKQADGNKGLVPSLQILIELGYTDYTIAFDADAHTNPDVTQATRELAITLREADCTVKIATGLWTADKGKGMDDFITQNNVEMFKEILERSLTLETWEQEIAGPVKKQRKSAKKSHAVIVGELSDFYSERFRYNLMTNEIEKDGKQYYLDSSHIHISQDTGIELSKSSAIDYLSEIARNNSYHPVVSYLNSVKHISSNFDVNATVENLHRMLSEITGVQDKLQLTFLTKTLVAAVNRALKPGCFFKNVCILYGGQNLGKSSFWRELAGNDFFNASYKGTSEKHDLMVLHSAWINEIPEFDKVYRKTDVADLKGIISNPFDKIVMPYARTAIKLHRSSIMVATTNRQDFLKDATGSTRFWVVLMPSKVNFKALLEYRNTIWSSAYNLYEHDHSYELSEHEQVSSAENNERYSDIDPLSVEVENICRLDEYSDELREFVTINNIWTSLHPDEDGRTLKPNEIRPIADTLTRLGYTNKKKRVNGKLVSGWELQNKKVENFGVTAVTTPETYTPQVLPCCYSDVTVTQSGVTEEQEMLPRLVDGNRCGNSAVTVDVQGFQASVTAVTAENQNFPEIVFQKTDDPLCADIGDWIEITADDLYPPLNKGKRFEVVEISPAYGVKVAIIKSGTAKAKPERVVSVAIPYKNIRMVSAP